MFVYIIVFVCFTVCFTDNFVNPFGIKNSRFQNTLAESKLKIVKDDDDDDDDDDYIIKDDVVPMETTEVEAANEVNADDHGDLVKNILETKKELESVSTFKNHADSVSNPHLVEIHISIFKRDSYSDI